jgi:hypothetical protein
VSRTGRSSRQPIVCNRGRYVATEDDGLDVAEADDVPATVARPAALEIDHPPRAGEERHAGRDRHVAGQSYGHTDRGRVVCHVCSLG